jgi:hypothetical protein
VLCFLAEKPALAAAHPGVGLGKYLGNAPLDPTGILIYGGGGHGKAVLELLRAGRVYRAIGVIDDGLPLGSEILGLPVVGGAASLKEWFNRGVRLAANGVGGIGNVAARLKIFDVLAQEGFSCPALVHPSAVIEPSVPTRVRLAASLCGQLRAHRIWLGGQYRGDNRARLHPGAGDQPLTRGCAGGLCTRGRPHPDRDEHYDQSQPDYRRGLLDW